MLGAVAGGEEFLQPLLLGLGRDKEEFVAGLQRLLRGGGQDPGTPDDGDQRGVLGPADVADADAGQGRLRRQRQLDQVGVTLAEPQQPDQVADADGLLDQGRHEAGRGDGDVDAPGLVEEPLVLRVVDPGDDARNPVLRLGEQRHHQVDLVVPGRRDHHVAALERGLVQRGDLAGVGEQPLGARHPLHRDRARRLVDQQDLVAVLQQLTGDGPAHGPRPRNGDPHRCPSSSGPSANAASTSATSSGRIITCTRSPSWSTVWEVGSIASPSRVRNATRTPVSS